MMNNDKLANNKYNLQRNYKQGWNQVVCNDKNTNFTDYLETGEIIEYIGIKNHREIEIENE